MIGIDTNLLVRFLTNDDPKQARFAEQLLEKNVVFVCKSVLLETEWVLRYTYERSPQAIFHAFEGLLGLPNITVEDPLAVVKTMEWYAKGLDFADAIHLASSIQMTNSFATLDKQFIKRARQLDVEFLTMP